MSSSCTCDDSTDVRGLCFTCIGDVEKITMSYFLQVLHCPCTPYALAYWIHNNHNDVYKTMMKTRKVSVFINPFPVQINLILDNIDKDDFWLCMDNMEKE